MHGNRNGHQKIHCIVDTFVKKSFACDQCGKNYDTEHGLKIHRARMHKGCAKVGGCRCEICDRIFTSRDEFNRHVEETHMSITSRIPSDDDEIMEVAKPARKIVKGKRKLKIVLPADADDDEMKSPPLPPLPPRSTKMKVKKKSKVYTPYSIRTRLSRTHDDYDANANPFATRQ